MKKSLSQKPARKPRSSTILGSEQVHREIAKANARVAVVAEKVTRKDEKVQREARLAIAETFDAWLDWMEETAPEQVEDVFFELGCFATATNRRRMFKHAKAPEGVAERVQEQVDRWKAEEEAAKAVAAEEAQGKSGDAEGHA